MKEYLNKDIMKITLNTNLKGLDGVEIPNTETGKILANAMVSGSKVEGFDTVKCWVLAQAFYKGNEVELTIVDLETLRNFIDKTETMAGLAKAQIMELLK